MATDNQIKMCNDTLTVIKDHLNEMLNCLQEVQAIVKEMNAAETPAPAPLPQDSNPQQKAAPDAEPAVKEAPRDAPATFPGWHSIRSWKRQQVQRG